jgi:uracil-DNA glycosylase family 4
MLVGERPGENEAREGEPFVGKAGDLLNGAMFKCRLNRDYIFVTNLVRDCDYTNADPTPEEIARDEHFLIEELSAVQPKYIGCLGRFSSRWFTGRDIQMMADHGTPYETEFGLVMPIFHPAAALYDASNVLPRVYSDLSRFYSMTKGELLPLVDLHSLPDYSELTNDDAQYAYTVVKNSTLIAFDTEWYTEPPYGSWGLSFSVAEGEAFVVRSYSTGCLEMIAQAIRETESTIILHNALADLKELRKMGIVVPPHRLRDSMVAAYHLQTEPQGLKPLARRWAGMQMSSYQDQIEPYEKQKAHDYIIKAAAIDWPKAEPRVVIEKGKARVKKPWGANQYLNNITMDMFVKKEHTINLRERWKKVDPTAKKIVEDALGPMPGADLRDVDDETAIYYSARDADATIRIDGPLMELHNQYELSPVMEIDMGAIPMIERMQDNGILLDLEHLTKLSNDWTDQMYRLEQQISDIAGRHIDPGSPDQVGRFLFSDLGLKPEVLTKKGKASTKKEALELVLVQVGRRKMGERITDGVNKIGKYREFSKLRDSFADVLPRLVSPDGRIRGRFLVTRVVSGRLAMKDPNLLAQPTRSDEAKKIREAFIAPDGCVMGDWDLDQVEMRVMADESGDEELINLFLTGQDVHSITASKMFGIPVSQVDKVKHRYPAKRVGFGNITGITGHGLQRQFILSGITHYTEDECDDMIAEWFKVYPGVRDYQNRRRQEARMHGYVRDRWGRIRFLPGIYSDDRRIRSEAERQSHSHTISAGAQGLIKIGMAKVWKEITEYWWPRGVHIEPLLQVHDELLMECDNRYQGEIDHMMVQCLSSVLPDSGIPITTEGAFGPSWAEAK